MRGVDLQKLLAMPGMMVGRTAGEGLAAMLSTDVRTPVPLFADEGHFDSELNRLAKQHGWRTYHTRNSRKSEEGFPDRVMIRGPVLIAAELKHGKNTATAAQRNWLDDFAAVRVVHSRLWYPTDWLEITALLTEGR